MAKKNVVMPQMGESITNGTITKWHKKTGDMIEIDEILLEISTDKVESEIPSPVEGRVEILHFKEGDTVDVGIVIAEIEEDPKAAHAESQPQEKKAPEEIKPKEVREEKTKEEPSLPRASAEKLPSSSSRRFYTPLVKAMAKKANLSLEELRHIKGSGAGGRVNKNDLLSYLDTAQTQKTSAQLSPAATVAPSQERGERVEIIPMDNMRKAIARNMMESKLTSPHVNSVEEVDITSLVKFREAFKKEFASQEGFSITYTHFIMYAVIQALKEFPLVNASIEGDHIVVKKNINLGFAVAVPQNGLLVPVIQNADNFNITGLARTAYQLSEKARAKKLSMEELQGGTFTLSNVGSFGTLFATPIILQPQVGIMAAGVIKKRPVVIESEHGESIGIRSLMYLTHTYDHRLVDGEMGGRFLAAVRKNLEEMSPSALF